MLVDLAVSRPSPKNILKTGSFMQRGTEGRPNYSTRNKLFCCLQNNWKCRWTKPKI